LNTHSHVQRGIAIGILAAGMLLPTIAAAQTSQANWGSGKWQFGATIYAYLPSIGGSTKFPAVTDGSSINISSDQIIDSLKFTFMGSLDVHNGRWGAFTDVIYLDVGGSKSQTRDFSIGNIGIPAGASADLDLDLKGWVWTVAGEYRVAADPAWTMDVLAGARMLDIEEKLSYAFSGNLGPISPAGRTGTSEVNQTLWDGIVGVKGRYAFGANREWVVPFYADVGTGQSDLTWQAAAGIGYAFRWGEIVAMWRYLDYNMKADKPIEDVNFNGPMFGVTLRW
jgi:hypothetical protein